MGGLLVSVGDALVGQQLAQPGVLVVHVFFPFPVAQAPVCDRFGRGLACWLRMVLGHAA
jgi:hypothetical protein